MANSLSTKPPAVKAILEPQCTHPPRAIVPPNIENPERPSERVLVATTHVEPELAVAHHTTSDPERREVEPGVARFVDDDLTGLESPVGEVAGVADETPDRVVRVILRQVGPERSAVGSVQMCIEQVGRRAEGNVVYGTSAPEQETRRMRLTGVEVQDLPERALHDGEPLDLPVLVMVRGTSDGA